jgi:hypothetical protein
MNNFAVVSTLLITLLAGPSTPAPQLTLEDISLPMLLAQKELDLATRQKDRYVNEVFADNILLYLHYLKGNVDATANKQLATTNQKAMDFEKVREPFSFSFTLTPGEVFTFHPDSLPEFQDKPKKTAFTTFKSTEGYRFVAGLWANGVCHIASLINWATQEAGLKVTAKVNHDFASIPGVPREFGTAIYYTDNTPTANQSQNLYVENTYTFPVTLNFTVTDTKVILTVSHPLTPALLFSPPPPPPAWL